VASTARDDPFPLPGMHREHNALLSQTDRRTLTSLHKREMYILHIALKSDGFQLHTHTHARTHAHAALG